MTLKAIIKGSFNSIGFEILNLKASRKILNERSDLRLIIDRLGYIIQNTILQNDSKSLQYSFLNYCSNKLFAVKSQLFQELFVLFCLKDKRSGFFVEFGATDGISLNNTYLLEKDYDWNGILVEPGKVWKKKLNKFRSCYIDNRCVWSKSGDKLIFSETNLPELSTIGAFSKVDFLSSKRKARKCYSVDTISLNDLLSFYHAPNTIDYLSIDTEGSEFEILNAFDFLNYKISIITVEHNFTLQRNDIYKLLLKNGYRRIFESISFFDDWYIHENLWNQFLGYN